MHGEGVLLQEDKAIHEGRWENGVRTTNLYKYPNGLVGVRNKEDKPVEPWAKNPELPPSGDVEKSLLPNYLNFKSNSRDYSPIRNAVSDMPK